MKAKTNYSIKRNEERDRLYQKWLSLTDETFSKSVDGAIELSMALYNNSQNLAQAQLVQIVPHKYLTKFLLKEMKK